MSRLVIWSLSLLALSAGVAAAQETPAAPAAAPPVAPAAAPPGACDRWRHPGMPEGPVVIGLYDADMSTGRRTCPRTELTIAARGAAVLDTPNFYGSLQADALIAGSYAVRRNLEVFGTLELIHYLFVQNASLKGTAVGLGQLTLGAAMVAFQRGPAVITPFGRLMLPTSSSTPNVRTLGGEAGVAWSVRPLDRLAVHGTFGVDITGGASAGPPDVRAGALLNVGLQYNPATWFGLVLDLNLQLGHRAPIDAFAPALGLRFRLYRGLAAELGVTAPVAGADRRLFLGALRIGYRF